MFSLRHLLTFIALGSFGAVHGQGVAPSPGLADSHPDDLYLLMGQSNMVGRDTAGLASQTTHPQVFTFTSADTWKIAREPLDPSNGSGMGPGSFFGAAVALDNILVGLIPTAVGGTPLNRWIKGGDLYENAVRRAKAALQTGGQLKGVVWHQGESDCLNPNDADTYETRLVQMLTSLRTDLGQPDLPIVIGQIGDFLQLPYAKTVRDALRDIPHRLKNVAFVDSAGLPHKGDHLHFTSAAQEELGHRYAKAMRELQGKLH